MNAVEQKLTDEFIREVAQDDNDINWCISRYLCKMTECRSNKDPFDQHMQDILDGMKIRVCKHQDGSYTYDKFPEKPPVGLTPKQIYFDKRLEDVVEAINRYIFARKKVPVDWINEYNDLLEMK